MTKTSNLLIPAGQLLHRYELMVRSQRTLLINLVRQLFPKITISEVEFFCLSVYEMIHKKTESRIFIFGGMEETLKHEPCGRSICQAGQQKSSASMSSHSFHPKRMHFQRLCVFVCVCVCLPSAKRGLVAEKAHNFLSSIYPDIHRSIHTTTCPPHTSLHPAEPWESVWRPPPHTRTSRPHIHLFSFHSFVIFPSPSPLCMCVCVCVCIHTHV